MNLLYLKLCAAGQPFREGGDYFSGNTPVNPAVDPEVPPPAPPPPPAAPPPAPVPAPPPTPTPAAPPPAPVPVPPSGAPNLTEEQKQFIAWQTGQPYPLFGGFVDGGLIGDQWNKQGTNPYADPDIIANAQREIDRQNSLVAITGQNPKDAKPWTDPNWPEYKLSNRQAWEQAKANASDPAARAAFQASSGLYGEDYESWQLQILDPQEWARQAKAANDKAGFVFGPSPPNGSFYGGTTVYGGTPTASPPPPAPVASGGNTNYINTGVPTTTSQQTQQTRQQVNDAIAGYIKNNPSNFVRRRNGLPPLSAAQPAARDEEIAKLNATQQSLAVKAASEEIPAIVSVSRTDITTSTKELLITNSAALNSQVNYLVDPQLERAVELQIGIDPRPLKQPAINVQEDQAYSGTGQAVEISRSKIYQVPGNAPINPGSTSVVKVFNDQTGTFDVYNNATGEIIKQNLGATAADQLIQQYTQPQPQVLRTVAGVDDTIGTPTADTAIIPRLGSSDTRQTFTGGSSVADPYVSAFDPETGTWGVWDNNTSQFVETGLTQQQSETNAVTKQAEAEAANAPIGAISPVSTTAGTPAAGDNRYVASEAEDGTWTVYDNQTGEVVETGLTEIEAINGAEDLNASVANQPDPNTFGDPAADEAAAEANTRGEAQDQQERQIQSKLANNGDWRVRLSLAPGADYLYNDTSGDGILLPLKNTGGVIFPYTPQIETNYRADYDAVALTHSNYKSYFYKSSYTDSINISATFTAQDTSEADYLLAVIHFFRSVTKMFYGQDALRGAPPPLVFLTGLGTYQFNNNACLVSNFQYSLPKDVDYIRARSVNIDGTNLLTRRIRQSVPANTITGAINRLNNLFSSQGISKGAEVVSRPPAPTLGLNSPTYVPTKMDMTITLLPVQTRDDVSKVFSLTDYANGTLVRKGFW